MFYFCPYPPSTQARYDLLQVQYLPPSQWFQPVARAYTFLTTHAYTYMHTCTHRNEQDSSPFFYSRPRHIPTCLRRSHPHPAWRRKSGGCRSICRRTGGGGAAATGLTAAPCAGLGSGIRLTEEARPHVYFACWTGRTGRPCLCVSLHTQTHTDTHTCTHTHIVTPATRQRGQPPPPEVGPIKSYMQVRWRGKTRSCKATQISFLIFHRPAA